MSNNAAVAGSGEIGRAQALQARAARLVPHVDMNPVLLKPQSEAGAQIVVQGRVVGQASAREYQSWKPRLLPLVLESFARLGRSVDLVLIEGAGSAAEINLRAADIANMGFARAVNTPVVLVGDIDRGGVIAQLVGCRAILDQDDARLVSGFIVNKFRGDPTLFQEACASSRRKPAGRRSVFCPSFRRPGGFRPRICFRFPKAATGTAISRSPCRSRRTSRISMISTR